MILSLKESHTRRVVFVAAYASIALTLTGCTSDKVASCQDFESKDECNNNENHGCSWYISKEPECIRTSGFDQYLESNPGVCTELGGTMESACRSTCKDNKLVAMAFSDVSNSEQDVIIGWPNTNQGTSDKAWGQNGVLFASGATRCLAKIKLDPAGGGSKALIEFAAGSACASSFKSGEQQIDATQFANLEPLKKDAGANACVAAECTIYSPSANAAECTEPHAVCSELSTTGDSVNACDASGLGFLGALAPCSKNSSNECKSAYEACDSRGVKNGHEGDSCSSTDGKYNWCKVGTGKKCVFNNGFKCAVLSSSTKTCGYTVTGQTTVNPIGEGDDWIDVCEYESPAPDGRCVGNYTEDL